MSPNEIVVSETEIDGVKIALTVPGDVVETAKSGMVVEGIVGFRASLTGESSQPADRVDPEDEFPPELELH